jgi:hypothetical protein
MACINKKTNENIYIITIIALYFYIAAPVIIYIESPIIKDTKVVTALERELKNLVFGNKHIPSNV